MPLSTDVKLSKDRRPVFPDRCVACGTSAPGNTYRASTHAIGWWTLAFWAIGPRYTVEVPACDPCLGRMSRQRWLRLAVNGVVIVAAVSVAGWVLQNYQGPFKAWLMMGIALACLLPLCVWEVFSPRPFDMTAYSKDVEYEFRNREYALEFIDANIADLQRQLDELESEEADPDGADH